MFKIKSNKLGKNTSAVEFLNLSPFGLWLGFDQKEYFLPFFKEYPWFKSANIQQIMNVQLLHHHHLHWPELDIDLELESLQRPEKYPLLYQ